MQYMIQICIVHSLQNIMYVRNNKPTYSNGNYYLSKFEFH